MNDNGMNNGQGPNEEDDQDNIVPLPTLAERDKIRREAEKEARRILNKSEPIINLPFATKWMLGVFIFIHLLTHYALNTEWVFIHLGFIPGSFTGTFPFTPLSLLTIFTHMLIHANWMHLIMNGVMMMAFGSGVERWMGPKRMIIFFILSGLCGVVLHFILSPTSIYPVVGASGALSGLFAAALVMLNTQKNAFTGRFGIFPFILLWIGITIIFGMMGGPDGTSIAWAAHLGGFLGGFIILKIMKL